MTLLRHSRAAVMALPLAMAAVQAHADLVQDWFSGATPAALVAPAAGLAPMELKFGHPAPPASLMTAQWQAMLKRISAVSSGVLQFKEYGAGTLLGPKDGFKAVRSGVAEFAPCYVVYEGANFTLSKVFELPLVASNKAAVNTRILFELAPKYFQPEFTRQDVLWAGAVGFSPTDIMSKRPIRTLDDLQGLKIVAQGMAPEVAKALGFTLVNIPYTDIYTALQQGVVDAVIWVDAGFVPYKIYEVVKNRTVLGLIGGSMPHCVNKEWFARLTPDQRRAFAGVIEPSFTAAAEITQTRFSEKANKTYEDNGVTTHRLSVQDMTRLQAKIAPVLAEWAEKNDKAGRPAKALLADIKRLRDKYEPLTVDELMKQAIGNPVQVLK